MFHPLKAPYCQPSSAWTSASESEAILCQPRQSLKWRLLSSQLLPQQVVVEVKVIESVDLLLLPSKVQSTLLTLVSLIRLVKLLLI